ncbi:MAG: hypothetical protein KME04_05375 [Pleurocapsa minor GSE-CHR-MK-17-07R]|jgi:hypothetical protein|nr:hypothetical protein [Pleurocapsa minor GSE-CHR-MK 17-07R]
MQILTSRIDYLPKGTAIFIEAYYRSSMMRFELGRLDGQLDQFSLRGERLTEIQSPRVTFRVKVVVRSGRHFGRIVGAIDRLQVLNRDSQDVDRIGLLPVRFEPLENLIWKVDFPDDGTDPMLCVNSELSVEFTSPSVLVRSNVTFQSLVFPEVVRRILEHILFEDNDEEDEDSWQVKWLQFARSYETEKLLPEADEFDKHRWIEDVLNAFSQSNRLKDNFEAALREHHS